MKSLVESILSSAIVENILSSTETGKSSFGPWYNFLCALKSMYPKMKYLDFDENHYLYVGFHKGARMTNKELEKISDMLDEYGCSKCNNHYINTDISNNRFFNEIKGRLSNGNSIFFAIYFKEIDEDFKSLNRNSILGSQEPGDFVFQLRPIEPFIDEEVMKQLLTLVKSW